MSRALRIRAAIQLTLFVGVTSGAPLLDAMLFHADAPHSVATHVESADGPACHAEQCVVGIATIAPPPLDRPAFQLRTEEPARRASVLHIAYRPFGRIPASPVGSRAPPA